MNQTKIVCVKASCLLIIALATLIWVKPVLGATPDSTETLALKLPGPSLKGTPPDVMPAGPNIEPYPDKAPPPFLAPKGVKNVAAGKRATSSSVPITGELTQLTDGKKEAEDYDSVEMKKGSQWVQVDLGEAYSIYAVVMWHDHRYVQVLSDVIVQASDDPEFQKGVTTLFNNDADNSSGLGVGGNREYFETRYGKVIDGKGVKARHVRCYTNGGTMTKFNCWQELEVYGLPVSSRNGDAVLPSTNAATAGTETLKLKLPAPALK